MPAPSSERLDLRRVLSDSGRIFARDFVVLMALAFGIHGAGIAAETILRGQLGDAAASRFTGGVAPWAASFVPFSLADGAIVWVALRRLLGGRSPRPLSVVAVLRLACVFVAIDLVENIPDLLQLLVPPAVAGRLGAAYDVLVPAAGALWLSLWFPALAVAAMGGGAAASLGRSLDLTLGRRWAIAGLALLLQVATLVCGLLLEVGLAAAGFDTVPGWWLELAGLPVWAFSSVTQASVYWELERLRTGLAPIGVAGVFD